MTLFGLNVRRRARCQGSLAGGSLGPTPCGRALWLLGTYSLYHGPGFESHSNPRFTASIRIKTCGGRKKRVGMRLFRRSRIWVGKGTFRIRSPAPFADEEIQVKDPSECLQSCPATYRPQLFLEGVLRALPNGLLRVGVFSVSMLLILHMLEKSENFVFQTDFSSLTKVLSSL